MSDFWYWWKSPYSELSQFWLFGHHFQTLIGHLKGKNKLFGGLIWKGLLQTLRIWQKTRDFDYSGVKINPCQTFDFRENRLKTFSLQKWYLEGRELNNLVAEYERVCPALPENDINSEFSKCQVFDLPWKSTETSFLGVCSG